MVNTPTLIEDGQTKTMNGSSGGGGHEEEEGTTNNNNDNDNDQNNNESDEDSDDDDEDNVKIVIDMRNTAQTNPSVLGRQLSGKMPTNPGAIGAPSATNIPIPPAAGATVKATQAKGIDLDAPGVINDGPTYDHDITELKDEDKPWRKPGADITDYFNYGFTEETWIGYCMKQKRLRQENTSFKV
jgi:pre-mRNA 3'-end-processing factor FIP1